MNLNQLRSKLKNSKGFTMVELVMVIMIVGVLAAVAIPQFQNYKAEAKVAATQHLLGAIRAAINNQTVQIQFRCGAAAGSHPTFAAINANTVIAHGCTTPAQVPTAGEGQFLADATWPAMPYSTTGSNTIEDCSLGSCVRGTGCAAGPAVSEHWCYNATTGDFWADSATAGVANY
jgi:MSHA pilin protein MshA